ncbi:hypothetical protein [Thiosocius teredinicola]|uniref:hypothetical protein n=1 Tax=Thiosocius teredinicola TaxID=1973002 RepID=UPI0009913A4B
MIRHLFVPGLLGPLPWAGHDDHPALPQIERLLARADRLFEPAGYAGGLFALFGIEQAAGSDLPTAAVSYFADAGEAPAGYLLHADPLRLVPDRDCLLAFDLDDDPLDDDERNELVQAFNAHYADDGLRLASDHSGRLYLQCEQAPSIRTRPLSAVIGRGLDGHLPVGDAQREWHSLLNETQMLCYGLDFNRQREALGRPTLGGLWFSGGGVLPPQGDGPEVRVVGECALARGLRQLRRGGERRELIVDRTVEQAVSRADKGSWVQALVALDNCVAILLDDCDELHLHPGNGGVHRWHAGAARRFWRRRRPLSAWLEDGPQAPVSRGSNKEL